MATKKRKQGSKSIKRPARRSRSAATPRTQGRLQARAKPKRGQKPSGSAFLRHAGEASFLLFALAFAAAGLAVYIGRDLPSTDQLWRDDGPARLAFVAADGTPLRHAGETRGAPVRISELPSHAVGAVLAIEDRNFYYHAGVNPLSIIRAMIINLQSGDIRQGGSTITQQLAKNLFLSPEKTYKRKLQEVFLAFWLEQRFSKDEILTLYLNHAYFGAGAVGLDAASRRYFDKPASRLSVAESAILAGLLKAPSAYAPHVNPDEAGRRARLVIEAMGEAGYLTYEEIEAALGDPVRLAASPLSGAPYFVDAAAAAARAFEAAPADLLVHTTLSMTLQKALEEGVAQGLAETGVGDDIELAAALIDSDGAVRAMIGGRDYRRSQFNRATQARRQPGSAFKPFIYAAAIEAGYRETDDLLDAPIKIGRWSPDNYADEYHGDVSMTTALSRSLNAASVRLQETIGRSAVRDVAGRMGLAGSLTDGPALALGVDAVTPLELAGAYAPLVNGGYRVRIRYFDRIETVDGGPVWSAPGGYDGEALRAETVDALNRMLRETVRSGTGRRAAMRGIAAAGKTGTTQDNRDAWFVGHAGGFVAVVWLGRDDNQPMASIGGEEITGGGAPAVIWRNIMERAVPQAAVTPQEKSRAP